MIVSAPKAADLAAAPELAILAALELALATSVEAVAARHPEIRRDSDLCDVQLGTEHALAICRQATALIAAINLYRLTLVVGDDI